MKYDLVHVTNVHSWNDVRIFHKMARTLAENGLNVAVVATSSDIDRETLETVDKVDIILLPRAPKLSRLKRATQLASKVSKKAITLDAKLYQLHDPELIPQMLLAALAGTKIIFDSHEDFVGQTDGKEWASGYRRLFVKGVAHTFRFLSSTFFASILTATKSIAQDFPASKTHVVNNYPIIGELQCSDATTKLTERPKRGVYMGNMSEIRGIRQIVEALDITKHVEGIDLAGSFDDPSFLQEMKALPGWSKVRYHGLLDRPKLAALLSGARFGIVTFHPLKNHISAQPNKLFEYLSAGLPVLFSDFPLWREIVNSEKLGSPVDPENPASLAIGMDKLVTAKNGDVAEIARDLISSHFSWQAEGEKYVELIQRLLQLNANSSINKG